MRLSEYNKGNYTPGKPLITQLLWYFLGSPLVSSRFLFISPVKIFILKLFQAKIGKKVRMKPGCRIKFPWKLTIGDFCWLGEDLWIDNLDQVTLENNVVLSQGAYLCTGNHDWSDHSFALQTAPIHIHDKVWIGAQCVVLPGSKCLEGSVLTAGSVSAKELQSWSIYQGNPAQKIKNREKQ